MFKVVLYILIIIIIILYIILNNIDDDVIDNYTKNYLKNKSATIVGTARDIQKYLYYTIKKIEMISSLFGNINIIVYENDSIDDTLDILNKWKNNSKYNIKIISEKNLPGKRTQRLSYARNILLNEALKLNNEYFIVMDLDDVNSLLTKKRFVSSFLYNNDWSCLCANQKYNYYDLWALRTKDDWLNYDCWDCIKNKKESGKEYDKEYEKCVGSKFKNLKPQKDLLEVNSCFGGLAIYKTKYIKNCKYYGGEGDKEVCEHVNFNKEIIEKNKGKIFINTNMINGNGKGMW
jgi:hypothetical protein